MAIVLDSYNQLKTKYCDFVDRLKQLDDGLRCCLDVDMLVYEYAPITISDIKLVPLESFSCQRTIVGSNGTNIDIDAPFGLVKEDFIEIDCVEVGVVEKHKRKLTGVLISNTNDYFEIFNQLAKHFGYIPSDNGNSFVLDEAEISELKIVPFNLKYVDNQFVVSNIEKEMDTSEYDAIVDRMYCCDYGI